MLCVTAEGANGKKKIFFFLQKVFYKKAHDRIGKSLMAELLAHLFYFIIQLNISETMGKKEHHLLAVIFSASTYYDDEKQLLGTIPEQQEHTIVSVL